jgi:hypothetical protein
MGLSRRGTRKLESVLGVKKIFNISFPSLNFGVKVMIVLAVVVLAMNVAGLSQYKKYLGLS